MSALAPPASTRGNSASASQTTVFALLVAAAASGGFQLRGEFILSPDSGLGYALGIIGGVMMLLLLVYPLRKHSNILRRLGAVHQWFRLHMLLGILGPLCILFHCNFSLGAVNSNIALLCMGLMVSSGLVGRFIYSRVHYGLYGHKISLEELKNDQMNSELFIVRRSEGAQVVSDALQQLKSLQDYAQRPLGLVARVWRLLTLSLWTRLLTWNIRRRLAGTQVPAQVNHYLDNYIDSMKKINGFAFFDRLFSLWHTLHLPIFFMLIITGLVHVWAVHYY
jgi:hypothetical protein